METKSELVGKKPYKVNTESLRVKKETKRKIQGLLAQINKKDFGRAVTPDALVSLAVSLLSSEHLESLKDQSLSNKDRLEQKYLDYCRRVSKVTRDEFFGILLNESILLRKE